LIKKYLEKNWEHFTGKPFPSSLDVVPITSCPNDYGNDVILIFTNRNPHPDYVMKIARTARYGSKLENEFNAIQYCSQIPSIAPYVPIPYYIGKSKQRIFFLQGGVPGTTLFRSIRKDGLTQHNERLLEQAVDLLATINTSRSHLDASMTSEKQTPVNILSRFEREFILSGISPKKIVELNNFLLQF